MKSTSHSVDVVFKNTSQHNLNWVTLNAGTRELSVGVLGPTYDATLGNVPWEGIPDDGKMTFIDQDSRKHYSVAISLAAVNGQVKAGGCREVTLTILSYDKAEASCK